MFAYLGGIVRELGGTALAVNGAADHTHALLMLPANLALADAMRVEDELLAVDSRTMATAKELRLADWVRGLQR